MKILLSRPYNTESFTIVPPLGLGYLVTSLLKNGISGTIFDCVKEKTGPDEFIEILKKEKPTVVGFTLFSSDLFEAKAYLTKVKEYNPKIITVLGGPHPSTMPLETFDFYKGLLDFAFAGEAEIGFPLLIKEILKGRTFQERMLKKIPGLIWKQNGVVKINPPHYVTNLDTLGFPSWNIIKPETYPHAPLGGFARRFPVGYILSSRACPFNCTFCSAKAVHGHVFRQRSLSHVMKEVRYLVKKRGIKELHILDDNFTIHKDFVKDFCRSVIREKLNFSWNCSNGIRLDRVDEETLFLMKKAGCYSVSVGIESGSSRILKHMKKNLTKETINQQIDIIRKVGLEVTGLFILGYPAETKKDILDTISFAKSLDINKASFNSFVPLPGSEMWEYLRKKKRLKHSYLSKLSYYRTDSNYMKNVSQKDFLQLQRKAFLDFYVRKKIILTLIHETSSPTHLWILLKRIGFYLQSWFLPRLKNSQILSK
jgi:anaerobic magnesium-protoporphyrin IX monomethyl ester cyclase